jgi:hypothetical protein
MGWAFAEKANTVKEKKKRSFRAICINGNLLEKY